MKTSAILLAAALALGGCAIVKVGDVYDTGADWELVVVPAGHMPPSGLCRIWYPDRHITQQPAAGDCNTLRDNVPEGAYLIRA